MRAKLVVLFLVSVLPLGLVIGCSQDVPLDEWLTSADAVCRRAQAAADANPAVQSPLPGDKIRLSATRTRDELEQLKELAAPEGSKSAVAEYLIVLGHRADVLDLYADALDKTPAQGPAPSRERLEDVTTDAYTQAVALGLEHCNGGVDFSVDTTSTTTSTVPDATPSTEPSSSTDSTTGENMVEQ